MLTKRFLLAVFALALMLPLTGCNGCRRNCNSRGSFAPPPAPCCNGQAPPVGYVPGPP